jgi:hypothetical protein
MEKYKVTKDNYKLTISSPDVIYLEIECDTKLDILVKENISSKLSIVSSNNYDINITIEKGSYILINSLNKDNSINANITVGENGKIIYNHGVSANNDSINRFTVKHLANNSESHIVNCGVNRKTNKLYFEVNGIVPKDLHNIICNQSSKIINFRKGDSKIIPNLIIDSNDIIANHSSYIGEIEEYLLFYMKSRGINKENVEKIVFRSTILGDMYLIDEEEEFNKIINEWW